VIGALDQACATADSVVRRVCCLTQPCGFDLIEHAEVVVCATQPSVNPAQEEPMSEKKFVNPPGLKPLGMYSNVACARGGTLVFISGQVAVDAEGKVVGKGDIQAQAVQVFENLKLCLAAAGGTFEDVLKFTIFIKNLTPEARKAVMGVRGRYISHTSPPAATMVGIDRLVEDDLLVEIEAVAMVG